MFTTLNQVTIFYQVEGSPNGLPLVWINSLGCDLHSWDEVVPAFSDRYRILRYDRRGQGLSQTVPGPYTLHDHTRDLAQLLDRLEIDTAILTGISVGGMVAMDFALSDPGRVRALVLSDTGPTIGTPESWEERIHAVREDGLPKMAEAILKRWFAPGFAQTHPNIYQIYLDKLSHASPEGYVATCAALRDADLRDDIKRITAPTLALCGAEDLVVTPEQTRAWAARLPHSRVEVIAGAAHLPNVEQPGAMAAAIERFLKEEFDV